MAIFNPQPFGQRYLLLDKIATGGMAEVFKAKSYGVEGFEKLVVIKRILPHLSRNTRFISMFINEAKTAVSLNHGNIVQVFHLGKQAEDYYIAMEYVHGRDLMQVLRLCRKLKRRLPTPLLLYAITEVARGLDYAHRKLDSAGNPLNIVHRDMSPHNIVISFEGDVKIVDFGIARIASKIMADGQKGRLGGKIAYMSPEQARGEEVDARSDLFSLGLVCYELLTGEKAYKGHGISEKLERVRRAEFVPLRDLRPDIGSELDQIVSRMLASHIEERYCSAGDLYEDLAELMFSDGGMVTAQGLASFMREIYADELAQEQQRSGLKAVVGSLERLDRGDAKSLEPGTLDGTPTGPSRPTWGEVDPNHTLTAGDLALVPWSESQRRNLIVLILELSGLTELSMKMEQATYMSLMSDLLPPLQRIGDNCHATLDGFFHERLTLIWGAVDDSWNFQDQALDCALHLYEWLAAFGEDRNLSLGAKLAIHNGLAMVGVSESRFHFLGIGDTFRLPERMLCQSEPGIVTSQAVRDLVHSRYVFDVDEPLQTDWARGETRVYRLLGARGAQLPAEGKPREAAARAGRRGDRWFPRRDELEELAAVLSAVDERHGTVAGLTGEPGIGKSRFVKEVGRLMLNRDVGWQVGQCYYRNREVPMSVFRNMLARGCRIKEGDSDKQVSEKLSILVEFGLHAADVRALSGLFGTSPEDAEGRADAGDITESAIFRAMRRMVRGMSADRPTVFVFENLEWMDSVSSRVLRELLELTRELPILVIVTYRAGLQLDITDMEQFTEIRLEPLDRERTSEMARALLNVDDLPPSLEAELYQRSRGNPLYIEQLVKLLFETGSLVVEGGKVVRAKLDGAAQVPETLHGLIESRVESLSELGRAVLLVLAVIGRQAPRAALGPATGLGAELDSVLQELRERDLVSLDPKQVSFRDYMTWEVAFNSVPAQALKDYHLRVALALEELYGADVVRHAEELYSHFESAAHFVKSARYAVLAGDRSLNEDFTSKAVDFYLKGVELLLGCNDDSLTEEQLLRDVAALCLKAGRLQWVLGQRNEAESTLERGLGYAGEAEDDKLEAKLLHAMGQLWADKGDRFLAQSYLEHALELAEAFDAKELSCEVLDTLGTFYLEGGEVEAAGRVFDKGLALAGHVDRSLALAQLLQGKGTYLFHRGEYEAALERFTRALDLCQDTGTVDRILCGRILNNVGNTYNFMNRYEEAMNAYRRSGEIYSAVGFMRGAITNLHNLGDLYFRKDRLAKAYGYFSESRNLAREYRWVLGEASNLVHMGYIEAAKGDPTKGLERLRDGCRLAREAGHPEVVATGYWLEGRYLASAEPEKARKVLQAALETAQTSGQRKLEEEICKELGKLS